MKVKVIKIYKDKYDRTLHNPGDELIMSKERFEEINSTARGIFVEEVENKKKTKKAGE